MQEIKIKRIVKKFNHKQTLYNLSVSTNNNYFANGILVHNCDDPNNSNEQESKSKLDRACKWYDQVWSTRLDNPKKDVRIVVQQRLHQDDITGHILKSEDANEWVKLVLPMEYESDRQSTTISFNNNDIKWKDPRTEEGELLVRDRFDVKEIDNLKKVLGTYGYAGQFQQRPAPAKGGIIQKDWFNIWTEQYTPELVNVIQSWDTALTAKTDSAYSACTTWGVFLDKEYKENIILLSVYRDKIEYPELRQIAKKLYYNYKLANYPKQVLDKGPAELGITLIKPARSVDMCLIEAKASGDPLLQDLNRLGIRVTPFNPSKYGDKMQRVRLVTPLIEGGLVWLPAREDGHLKGYAKEFLDEVLLFPNSSARDLVDTMTQVLLKLKSNNVFTLYNDDIDNNVDVYRNIKRY